MTINPWILLALAIISELAGSTVLKATQGFKKPLYVVALVFFYGLSFYLMSQSLAVIPLGIAYAVWSGVGIAATALIGLLVFRESFSPGRISGLLLIIVGVILLNLSKSGGAA